MEWALNRLHWIITFIIMSTEFSTNRTNELFIIGQYIVVGFDKRFSIVLNINNNWNCIDVENRLLHSKQINSRHRWNRQNHLSSVRYEDCYQLKSLSFTRIRTDFVNFVNRASHKNIRFHLNEQCISHVKFIYGICTLYTVHRTPHVL